MSPECRSLLFVIALSGLFATWLWLSGEKPGLFLVVIYLTLIMSAEGGLYSNMNALAMEPLSKSAGMGASLVSLISMLVSVPLGIIAGRMLNMSILPLVLAFAAFALLALTIMVAVERYRLRTLNTSAETLSSLGYITATIIPSDKAK